MIAALAILATLVIARGLIRVREAAIAPPETVRLMREMIAQRKFTDLVDFAERDRSFVGLALFPALLQAPVWDSMVRVMDSSARVQTADLHAAVAPLLTIGCVAPLLGGVAMLLSLMRIVRHAGNGAINPGDARARRDAARHAVWGMIPTVLGLILAVVCLCFHGYLQSRVDQLTQRATQQANELLTMIHPRAEKPTAAASSSKD